MSTVLIQRDDRFQPTGIWVFVDDVDVVREILADYDADASEDFILALETVPSCPESDAALAESGGRDGYLGECPSAWSNL